MKLISSFLFLLLFSALSFAQTHFLTIADIHYGQQNSTVKGQDTGPQLFDEGMKKFTQLAAEADFIINLGDLPAHGIYSISKKESDEKFIFQALRNANTSQKPLFYVTGNNDSLEGNYQPFSYQGKSPLRLAEQWDGACLNCQNLMINNDHMEEGGYYSSYAMPSNKEIVFIALNSIQFIDAVAQRLPLYPNQEEDASQQLDWLALQLKKNTAKQLLIAMHVPPGADYRGKRYWQESYQAQFLRLLQKYKEHYQQITLLTAHTHMDEIRKIRLNNGATIYAFSTPGLSPVHGNNPAMKTFTLATDYELTNFTTHYTTEEKSWTDEYYDAINAENSIFPECNGQSLASCLDGLDKKQVCKKIAAEFFYSVRNNEVDNSACLKIYSVNLN